MSVIVPFRGAVDEAEAALEGLAALRLRRGDELLLVDNSPGGTGLAPSKAAPAVRIVPAPDRRSSYHARNVGAGAAVNEWLLYVDADCRPAAALLDDYFASPLSPRCGAVAGAVEPLAGSGILARYAESRGYLDQRGFMVRPRPFAATANLLVRRATWQELGGFREVRSAGDVDFCWRLQDSGWTLELREGASVEHRHRAALLPLLRQRVRYGAGIAWLARYHEPAEPPPRPVRGAVRSLLAAVGSAGRGERQEAVFRLIDALSFAAHLVGSRLSNEPPGPAAVPQRRASRSASRPNSRPRA